jgi:hypothetical protein
MRPCARCKPGDGPVPAAYRPGLPLAAARPCGSPLNTVFSQCGGVCLSHTFEDMNDYLAFQLQQIDRARTFADIRRIEDRASRMAQATPQARRGSAWLLRVLGRRPRAVASCCTAS